MSDKTSDQKTSKEQSRRAALNKIGKYSAGGAALAFTVSRANAMGSDNSNGNCSSMGASSSGNTC